MSHIVIVGGGAVLAQPLIDHYLSDQDNSVTVYCREKLPSEPWPNRLQVLTDYNAPIKGVDVLIIMPAHFDNNPLIGMTLSQWNTVIERTLTVPFLALRTFLTQGLRNGSNVVIVGSIAGKLGGRGCANYAAAKAGLVGLVATAANENWDRGICINLLELGYMDVGMGARLSEKVRESTKLAIPLRRFGTVEDFVLAVEFLSKTRYMTGNVLTIAGGLR